MMSGESSYRFSEYQQMALLLFRCVLCKEPMTVQPSFLSCSRCGHRYPIGTTGIIHVIGRDLQKLTAAQRAGQWKIVAGNYDLLWRQRALTLLTGRPFSPKEELDLVAKNVDIFSEKTILDNACGNAFYGRGIAKRLEQGGRPGVIVANDISLEMLNQARKLAVQEKVEHRILFVRSDSESMPFQAEIFDGVVCGGSLNEFTSPVQVLSEFQRVMTTGATASVMFQVLSQNKVLALMQKVLGALSGLEFLSPSEASYRLSKLFDLNDLIQEGVILIARLSMANSAGRLEKEEILGRSTLDTRASTTTQDLHQRAREPIFIFDVNGI